ncbi:MAG TPA: glutamate racemase [Eubacteriaceae bacterium]|nr:glutamate racemase [Eubacteriaceae bacterium]
MNDKERPIGILDSGVGGLTVVKEMGTVLPKENVLYFGDSKRMPYGNRREEEIIHYANSMIAFLEAKGVKAILLACNTVSSYIDQLKSKVPLFGIIEAGCLAADEVSTEDQIGLIATVATVESGVYDKTMEKIDRSKRLISNNSKKLPQVINDQLKHSYLLNKHIQECIDPILEKGEIRELILGCSHFPIIEKEISEIYPGLRLINPARRQVELLEQFLEEQGWLNERPKRRIEVYTTARTKEFELVLERLGILQYELKKVALLEEDDNE